MIERYSRKEMSRIWEPENRFRKWLEIEILACEAWAKLGKIPQKALDTIKARADFDMQSIDEIEKTVKHDVIAFLTSVAEFVGSDSRYIHRGLTSSDILDTSLALLLREAADLVVADIKGVMGVIKDRAFEHKHTVMIGRSHGIHAEPITFGLKMALWYAETLRDIERLESAIKSIAVGQISGAVGTFQHLDPSVERHVCQNLGLEPAPVSTQVLQRDRHAEFMCMLALIGCSLEKFATEVRHLQKTEVLEAEEYFSKGQKGSSAMPHKRNPITCERIAGLSRVLRGNASAAMENVALWHERDITHSSVERVIIPDSCILLDYMLDQFTKVMDTLLVYPDRMEKNLNLTRGLIYSQEVLLALTKKGMKREDAYKIVQERAMEVWKNGSDFRTLIANTPEVRQHLKANELEELFDPKRSLTHVDEIFARVGLD